MEPDTFVEEYDQNSDEMIEKKRLITNNDASPHSLRYTNIRWLFLFFVSFLDFGSGYCSSMISALETNLEHDLGITTFQYSLFLSVYSLPNIILPLIGGYFIDRVGVRRSGIIFQSIIFFGQIIFMLGGYFKNFWIMVAGRFVFGMGCECICVTGGAIVPLWFGKKELGLAMGLSLAVSRISSSFASFLSPKLYSTSDSLNLPLFAGLIACGVAFCCHSTANWLDIKRENSEENKEKPILDESEKVSFKDIKYFKTSIWLIIGITGLVYCSFNSFLNIANSFIIDRFAFDQSSAGDLLTIFYILSVILTPIFGYMIDKYGQRVKFIMVSIIGLIASFMVLLFVRNATIPNYIILLPLIGFGIFFTIFTSIIWPCYPLVVYKKYIGTANGLGYSAQNAALTLGALMVGYLKDNNLDDGQYGYKSVIVALGILAVIGAFLTAQLWRVDNKTGEVLNNPPPLEVEPATPKTEVPTEELKPIVSS